MTHFLEKPILNAVSRRKKARDINPGSYAMLCYAMLCYAMLVVAQCTAYAVHFYH